MQVDLESFEASTCFPAKSPLLPTKGSVCIPPGGRDCPHKMAPYPINPMPIIFRARQELLWRLSSSQLTSVRL